MGYSPVALYFGELATRDRLHRWGVIDCATCVLCTTFDESHEHLFFGCPFSTSVWHYFLVKNSIHRPCFPLLNAIQWIDVHRGGATLQTLLALVSCAAVVYHLWRERNRRIFQGMSSTPDQIISVVASVIRGYVKIKRRQHLVEKEVEPIFSKDDMKNGPTTEATCPNCSFGKAVFQQLQIRSADEPMSTFYWCLNEKCGQQWRED
ncbi:hypothetical protein RHMOL_Rhmol07G0003000 [Rhododendron molle]|uniref:Uncharacterized protein n=1 Tax=Rhododendron molle TaxID=49168 RepID=A0ACC0MWM9_RHOML|nr:hypothetical protein RHMOL_Rhmol07G0003000 [Rhododendron molle]